MNDTASLACPVWCIHHGRTSHPTADEIHEGLLPGTAEHVRAFVVDPRPTSRMAVELFALTEPVGPSGQMSEGPGISLAGLYDAVTAGILLTADDARALARALREAAAMLDHRDL